MALRERRRRNTVVRGRYKADPVQEHVFAWIATSQGHCQFADRLTVILAKNEFLLDWEASVADTRIHGTTKRQGAACVDNRRVSNGCGKTRVAK